MKKFDEGRQETETRLLKPLSANPLVVKFDISNVTKKLNHQMLSRTHETLHQK